MAAQSASGRKILWLNVLTVVSAAIGLYVMYRFINSARRVEPFSARQ